MAKKLKEFFLYNIVAIIIAIQLVVLLNYWYFIYKNITEAAINDSIAYQGKVVDANSVAIDDGLYNMRFSVYTADCTSAPCADSNDFVWTEYWDGTTRSGAQAVAKQVQITEGVFTVELNSLCQDWVGSCAQNGGVDFDTGSLYLQVELDTDNNGSYEELFLPRKRFSATPYAMNSDKVNGKSVGTSGSTIPILDAANTWSGIQTIQPASAANQALILKGAASQSANLLEFQTSGGIAQTVVNASGLIDADSVITKKITSDATADGNGTIPSTLDNDIIAYWKMDDGSGTAVTDEEGAYQGTLTEGGGGWSGSGYFGYTGDDSLTFDGSSTRIDAGDIDEIDGATAFSVVGWFKPDSVNSRQEYLWSKDGGGTSRTHLAAWNDSKIYIRFTNGNSLSGGSISNSVLTAGEWHSVVVTYDGAAATDAEKLKIYVNGAAQTITFDAAVPATTATSSASFVIGAEDTAGNNSFDGDIDNTIIYSRALTAGEAANIYQNGLPSTTALTIDTASEIASGNLVSVQNNGTEKFAIDKDGAVSFVGGTSTGAMVIDLDSDSDALVVQGVDSQTNNLIELQSSTGTVLSVFNSSGYLDTANVITDQITSDAQPEPTAPTTQDGTIVSYWKMDDDGIFPEDSSDASLMAWWEFEEGSGTTLGDSSGNGYDGSISNAVWTGSGAFTDSTDSLTFDGTNDQVDTISNETDFDFDITDSFSVGAWVYITDGTGNNQVIGNGVSGGKGWIMFVQNGQMRFGFVQSGGDFVTKQTSSLSDNTWYYLAGTWDNGTPNVYVNGVLDNNADVNNGTLTSGAPSGGELMIGNRTGSDMDFNGRVDNVAIYSDIRSAAEISRDYYKTRSSYIADEVDVNQGLLAGNTTFIGTDNGALGYAGDNGLTFDGTDDYVDVDETDFKSLSSGTVEFWAYGNAGNSGQVVTLGDNSASSYYVIGSDSGKYGVRYQKAGADQLEFNSNTLVTDQTWHHIVFTVGPSGNAFYVDGEAVTPTYLDGSASTALFFSDNSANWDKMTIGANRFNGLIGGDWNGKIDNVVIYNDVLTAQEVQNHYNNAIGGGVGNIFDTQNAFSGSDATLLSVRTAGTEKLSIGVNIITFAGDADNTLQVGRTTEASTAGYDLNVKAGGAVSGGTDLAGGDLYLISGLSTGTGGSNIYFQTPDPAGSTGSADNSLVTRLTIAADGSVQIADGGELRFYDGSSYVGLKAPTLSGDQIWSLPAADGSDGQVLKTDGSGNLSWADSSGGGSAADSYTLVEEIIISSDTQNQDFAATLDGDSDGSYVVELAGYNNSGSNSLVILRVNGSSIAGDRLYTLNSGGSVSGSQDTNAHFFSMQTGKAYLLRAEIKKSSTDSTIERGVYYESNVWYSNSMRAFSGFIEMSTPSKTTNITSLGFGTDQSGALGAGTVMRLYKLK